MSDSIFPWLNPMGLSSQSFQNKPEGVSALVWGLQNNVVNGQAYNQWASEHYGLACVKPEFFNFAMDFSLIQKYGEAHQWSEHCYPIYQWQDIVYVACLEPLKAPLPFKVCYVLAPLESLEQAWGRFEKTQGDAVVETPPANEGDAIIVAPANESNTNQEEASPVPVAVSSEGLEGLDSLDFGDLKQEVHVTEPVPVETPEAPVQEDALDLDFSSISTDEPKAPQAPSVEVQASESENTPSSAPDFAVPVETPTPTESSVEATPQSSAPSAAIDFGLQKPQVKQSEELQSTPATEETPAASSNEAVGFVMVDTPTAPSPDEANAVMVDTPQEAVPSNDEAPSFDLSNLEVPSPTAVAPQPAAESHVPAENFISEDDFQKAALLDSVTSVKLVVAHLFSHLRRDYEKLLWVEKSANGQFLPKAVHGNWAMTQTAWQSPINISEPNIFKIAFTSRLPFHGKIAVNGVNEQYFAQWTQSVPPDVCTLVPVTAHDEVIGFICCFDRNKEFDYHGSLKKVENLISIGKSHIEKLYSSQAA